MKLSIDSIANQIRVIITPLIIRRSRLDLDAIPEYKEDLRVQDIKFSKVNPPELQDYELGDLRELYTYTLQRISRQGEDGKPADYDDIQDEESGENN